MLVYEGTRKIGAYYCRSDVHRKLGIPGKQEAPNE